MRMTNQDLVTEARTLFPGGVNSPVRSFRSVGGNPVPIARGEGPFVFDTEGTRYIDYIGAFGPLILGHAPAELLRPYGAPPARALPSVRSRPARSNSDAGSLPRRGSSASVS